MFFIKRKQMLSTLHKSYKDNCGKETIIRRFTFRCDIACVI